MFRGKKGGEQATGDVMGGHVNRDERAPDMAIYGGNAFGHSVSPTAHLFADPAPIGLFMFGLASVLSAGHNLRWTPESVSYVIFTFTFISGGLIPLVVSLLEIIRNNMFAAVTFATYGSFFLSYTFFGLMYATGQFPLLVQAGLPLEGLQMALLLYALLSVIFIGLSIRMNFALTCLFTTIALAYFCLGIGLTHDERRVTKAGGYFSLGVCITTWWLALAELVFDVTGKPYIPVFWYPWGQESKMHAVMSSRRALDPHMQAAIAESQSKKKLNASRQPVNHGETAV